MFVVCRLVTVAALLLHLLFGCSLHQAAAGGTHRLHECQQAQEHGAFETIGPESGPSGHGCGHHHDHVNRFDPETNSIDQVAGRLMAPCCLCELPPCDGDHPGCHGEVECSFVPSSDVVFVINAPFVMLVTRAHDPLKSYLDSLESRGSGHRSAIGARDSLSHCASLCTWII